MKMEQAERLAEQIKDVTMIVSFMDGAALNESKKQLEDSLSKNESIGCMFDPMGYERKSDFLKQGIKKIEALIMFKTAIIKHIKDSVEHQDKKGQLKGVLKNMGLDF